MATLGEVFGVAAKPVRSYVERADVDDRFAEALCTDKQVVVYGSSKQGKTALVSTHLPYDKNILVSLTPKTSVLDIYQTILSKVGVTISRITTEKSATESSLSLTAKFKASIPLFGAGSVGTASGLKAGSGKETRFEEIPINLELPQHVAELLSRVQARKWIILENFHYLTEEAQKQFAFDLRAYHELGIRFVILGVWREKNRMAQFNGDLLDRLVEIPVEPWTAKDFRRVVERGAPDLNISISPDLIERAIEASFSSIGVFQELLKGICAAAHIVGSGMRHTTLADPELLRVTIASKAQEYAARHQRALEAIAAGHATGGTKKDMQPLHLSYYLVRVILETGFEGIANGMSRGDLHEAIRRIHHRGDDVRGSDMSNLLRGLANLQAAKSISPPIIDYDAQNRMLQVVDSTFYFFIKHVNAKDLLQSLPDPV